MRPYKPYIPQTPGEVWDLIGSMVLNAPKFTDEDFPGKDIDTEFFELVEGLKVIRKRLGEDRYATLVEMAERTKALFVAATNDDADEVWAGRNLLLEMEEVLNQIRRKTPQAPTASH